MARIDLAGRLALALMAALAVASCGEGNPFNEPEEPGTGGGGGGGGTTDPDNGGIDSDGRLPPGTASPEPDESIYRYESDDGEGGGYVSDVTYNSATDTFTVDGLAFDGDNNYTRDNQVGSLGPFAVYEGAAEVTDPFNGQPVQQFQHKAIYGVSTSGQTEFAIVRTGQYAGYGFGGFVYQRNGGVTLPTSGQATYSGEYAGLRVFDGRTGVEYTTGDMAVSIDFEDFNDGSGVQGSVTNRRIYDAAGNDITSDVTDGLPGTELPTLEFVVGPGVADANGEIVGGVTSHTTDGGVAQEYEAGKYYAVVSGNNAEEIVGVIVVTSDDPRMDGVTVQETGGFIVYR